MFSAGKLQRVVDSKTCAGGDVLLHNTLQELQSTKGDLAKQASEHYSRPRLPKHTPGNTHQQYCI